MRVRCIFFKVKINKRVVIDYKKSLMNMNKIFISWAETNQVFCFYFVQYSIASKFCVDYRNQNNRNLRNMYEPRA